VGHDDAMDNVDGIIGGKNDESKGNDIDDIESIPDVNIDEEFDAFDLEEFKKKYLNRDKHL